MVNSKSRAISLLALLLISSIVLVVSLSALGFFDPIPDGELIWQLDLNSMHIRPRSVEVKWLKEDLPQSPRSIQLTAAHDSGDLDSAYGLLLGQEDGSIAVMVSPLGYAAIWQQPSSADPKNVGYYLPWQSWPHIQTADRTNELLVYLEDDTLRVRVNGEWLWEENGIERIDRIGISGVSYGEDVFIDFKSAELSAVQSNN